MSRSSLETISSHLHIIIHIFNLLDFEDQLRLSQVSVNLKCVFQSYIWRQNYQALKIFEKPPDFVVSNDSDLNRLYLNSRGFEEFLRCYAICVNKLTVRNTVLDNSELCGLPEVAAGHLIETHQLDVRLFPNITNLQYHYMMVPTDHLKQVAEFHPNLQELRLIKCFFDDEFHELLNVISQMKNLKTLLIHAWEPFKIKHKQLHKVVKKLQLESLELSGEVEPDESDDEANHSLDNQLHLRELYLAAPCDAKSWPNTTSYPIFLRNFELLSILTIQIIDEVTDKVLKTFSQTCQHLQEFNIRFAEFKDIQIFSLPAKVTNLCLTWCQGLSHNNLKQILTESKVSKFYSKDTCYEGTCEDIYIPSRITSLHLPFPLGCNLIFAQCGTNLKDMTWYRPLKNNDGVTGPLLESCVNLQDLVTQDFHLPLAIVLKMVSLHKLTMPHPWPSINWCYITSILKHPPLCELIIREYRKAGGYQEMVSDVPKVGFATNVKKLEIPLDIFNVAIDFWLDIFNKNKSLKRICCTFSTYTNYIDFLKCIIEHKHFPRSVKSIDICGFVLDCNDLRKDFWILMKQLEYQIDFTEYIYDDDSSHHIILQKIS